MEGGFMGTGKKVLIVLLLMACSYGAGFLTASDVAWQDVRSAFDGLGDDIDHETPFISNPPLDSLDRVYVEEVVDGDTIDVRFPSQKSERVRLLGIDTPESYGDNDPSKWLGIDDAIVLDSWGIKAKEFTTQELAHSCVYLQYDPVAGERGYYGRLLAYVILENETNFNALLIEEGYARAYTSAECEYLETFVALEEEAQDKGKGVWSDASYAAKEGVQIDTINPYEEYVVITNYTDDPIEMAGWTLEDKAGYVYSFPTGFVLEAGKTVRVHTFAGEDTETSLYWSNTENIWNNSSDEAYLYDKAHSRVDEFIY